MKRSEILAQYTVQNGIIKNPGQFDGEPIYLPHYWDIYLNGGADRDNGQIIGFDISADDKLEFPELKNRRTIRMIQTESGFICEV